jgi:hypothetical protein
MPVIPKYQYEVLSFLVIYYFKELILRWMNFEKPCS